MKKLFLILLLFFSLNGYSQFIVNSYQFGIAYDPDAQAFFTASGLSDATQMSAINQLVIDLKAASIWTKYKAIYPFVGGSAALHKWNLKDPQDTDGAFRLTFAGTWSHTSSGGDPNGTDAYADTHIIPSTDLNLNTISLQFYSTENVNTISGYDMGTSTSATPHLTMIIKFFANSATFGALNENQVSLGNIVSDTRGLYTWTRTSSTAAAYYRNTTSIATSVTQTGATRDNIAITIGKCNGVASSFQNRNCAFAAILNDGLTSGEVTSAYNAIQAYQTSLSRQQ